VSPEVWQECRTIIAATADEYQLPVEYPNDDFTVPEPLNAWVSIDIGGDAAETIELGNLSWIERGSVWIHIMVPFNSGIVDGLTWRKAFSTAFRASTPTTPGLFWRDHSFDPLSPDDGPWRRLTLIVRYDYDDRVTTAHLALARARLTGAGDIGATP
jgi:hypothetical protein